MPQGQSIRCDLDPTVTSRGTGRTLYAVLIEILKQWGVRTIYASVTMPNPHSEKLHEKLGFRLIGTFHRAGFKNNLWHDTAWFEKEITLCDAPPKALIPFSRIAPETINRLIGRFHDFSL